MPTAAIVTSTAGHRASCASRAKLRNPENPVGAQPMTTHQILSREDWTAARRKLLDDEKAFPKARDKLSAARRAVAGRKCETTYVFDSENGPVSLSGLFAGRSQLLVYHFMFGPDWEAGCESCSFWAGHFVCLL